VEEELEQLLSVIYFIEFTRRIPYQARYWWFWWLNKEDK